jgi:hypothetical protein
MKSTREKPIPNRIRPSGVDLRQHVRFDLQAVGDPVGGVEEVYHCHDLYHGRVV